MMETREPLPMCPHRLTGALELRPVAVDEAAILGLQLMAMEPWRSLGFTATGLERYFTRVDPGLHRYSVLWEGRLAGVVAVRYPWLRGAYLELLGLFAETQGRGMGQHIIAWLVSETSIGGANLWATVSASNHGARCFYEKQGFVPIGDIPNLVREGYTEILLRLPLQDGRTGQQQQN